MQIYLNPSPVTEQLKEISLDKISCLILNEIEAADLCAAEWKKQKQAGNSLSRIPEECARALHSLHPGLQILLTMGTKGSIFLSRQKFHFQEAFPVNAVDTTAALAILLPDTSLQLFPETKLWRQPWRKQQRHPLLL